MDLSQDYVDAMFERFADSGDPLLAAAVASHSRCPPKLLVSFGRSRDLKVLSAVFLMFLLRLTRWR